MFIDLLCNVLKGWREKYARLDWTEKRPRGNGEMPGGERRNAQGGMEKLTIFGTDRNTPMDKGY